jgi:hypothetical protein
VAILLGVNRSGSVVASLDGTHQIYWLIVYSNVRCIIKIFCCKVIPIMMDGDICGGLQYSKVIALREWHWHVTLSFGSTKLL